METIRIAFYGFLDSLPNEDYEKIKAFFSEFDLNFSVSNKEKRKFKYDFERAIMTLYDKGVPMDEILRRLSLSNLAGFIARPSVMCFRSTMRRKSIPFQWITTDSLCSAFPCT
jgi:hypothetical protein